MADAMRSVLPKRRRSMGGPRALRHDIRAAADLRSLLLRWRDLNAFKTRPRAHVGPCERSLSGASRPLPFVSAKVPCLITQRTFSQRGGNGSSCPKADLQRGSE